MPTETKLNYCTFCDAHKDKVKKLIVSEDVAICSDCVDLCNKLMLDEENEKLEPVFPVQLTYLKLFELSWVFENNVTVQRFNFNDYFDLLLSILNESQPFFLPLLQLFSF
jgi:hypothetical protein